MILSRHDMIGKLNSLVDGVNSRRLDRGREDTERDCGDSQGESRTVEAVEKQELEGKCRKAKVWRKACCRIIGGRSHCQRSLARISTGFADRRRPEVHRVRERHHSAHVVVRSVGRTE